MLRFVCVLSHQYFTEANEADSWMTDKAGLAANQDYGKDELSAEKLLTRHTALQLAVDTYSPVIQGLAEQARKLVQSDHFAASKIASRQVKCSRMTLQVSVYSGALTLFRISERHLCRHHWISGIIKNWTIV